MRSRWIVLLVALTVGAAACGGGSSVAAKKKKPVVTTTTPGPPVAPLTGLPDPTGQSLTRPALSIKIENTPEARPQTGLDVADVVYEEITEAGITRFLAVYNSTIPAMAGPVRSGRIMDPDLLAPLGGIFAYSGGIQLTETAISQTPGVNVIVDTGADPALIRDHTKQAPHNLYAIPNLLLARGGKPVPPAPLFQYLATGQPFVGQGVSSFTVHFDDLYRPTYTYDPVSNTWKRSIGLTPFMDTDGAAGRADERDRPVRGLLPVQPGGWQLPDGRQRRRGLLQRRAGGTRPLGAQRRTPSRSSTRTRTATRSS